MVGAVKLSMKSQGREGRCQFSNVWWNHNYGEILPSYEMYVTFEGGAFETNSLLKRFILPFCSTIPVFFIPRSFMSLPVLKWEYISTL